MRRWASEHMKKKLTGTGGPALVSAYNVMTQVRDLLGCGKADSPYATSKAACMYPSTFRRLRQARVGGTGAGLQCPGSAELHLNTD